jgi:NAD+ kinase
MLLARWVQDGAHREHVAFNDVVLSRVPGRGQALLALSVDGQLLVRYASDGVIAATPAGSTAYSYAAGGPIVSPQTRAMIVTPDAPHGLFNRAVVLGDDECLGVEVLLSSAPVAVEVDGRLLVEAQAGWNVEVTPNPYPALVVRLGSAGFAERARRKLGITDPAALADYDLAGHER